MKKVAIELFKNIAGTTEYFFKKLKYPTDELIVLCMHSTPADHRQHFENIVDFLLKHFTPLDPKQLDEYYSGKLTNGPCVLFTFDDGLKNNLHAANALEKRGIKALFFIVPEFIKSQNQRAFYLKNIRPVTDPSFDKAEEDFTAMSFDDLRMLQNSGHVIGSHSSSHTLHNKMSQLELTSEIVDCKNELAGELSISPSTFCSINNTSLSVNSEAKKIISENYNYHFTTFPGLNSTDKNRQLIYRRNIEVNWTKGKIKFSLGQADLARWLGAIQQFQAL